MGYRDIFNIVTVLYWLYMDIMVVNGIRFGCHRGDTIMFFSSSWNGISKALVMG